MNKGNKIKKDCYYVRVWNLGCSYLHKILVHVVIIF